LALAIGSTQDKLTSNEVLARARARAALIPDLLVEAQQIANTVTSGWHGRKKRGSGDTFWQFRPYDQSESLSRIDWRRSARDDSVYVRDQEWESAHTAWVWADSSPSMLYRSETSDVSKQSRALVLALAMTEVLAKSGERVGWPGVTNALSHRNACERIAAQLMVAKENSGALPIADQMRARSEAVVFSDFLQPIEDTLEWINALSQRGVRGSIVQIIDPAEESFPFAGRTEFKDPETNSKFTFGRAETVAQDYKNLFAARKEELASQCRKLGWNYLAHHTDSLASTALVSLHMKLTGDAGKALS
jgi:uncharacterized protein (DUF58 family)